MKNIKNIKNIIEKMSPEGKMALTAIAYAVITLLLRIWDPEFLYWFHVAPMREVSFLRNLWQTAWFGFHIIYAITVLHFVFWIVIMALALVSVVTVFVLDVFILIYNLTTRITKRSKIKEIDFDWIKDIINKVHDYKVFDSEIGDLMMPSLATFGMLSVVFGIQLAFTL